jgi:hypothetical protein
MKILEKIKSLSLVALAAIFFLSATLISCGDGKKEAASEEESTEEVMMEDEAIEEEMPMEEEMDSTMHEEGEHEEHPTEGGSEHPAN